MPAKPRSTEKRTQEALKIDAHWVVSASAAATGRHD